MEIRKLMSLFLSTYLSRTRGLGAIPLRSADVQDALMLRAHGSAGAANQKLNVTAFTTNA